MLTIGLMCLAFVTWFWLSHASAETPGDAHNYVLAGLRLNAGHSIYSYGPGDERSFVPSGGADYALFSPPLIAVVFRAIVLLPANGQYIWWASMDVLELLAVLALVRRAPFVTGLVLIPLSLSIGLVMETGNVDCLLAAGLLLAWCELVRGHGDRAALLIALLASLKLTPVIFVWWLFVTGRRRAAGIAIGAGILLAFVAMLGSEPLIFVKFYQVTMTNLSAPLSDLGPPGLARAIGLPAIVVAWLPRAILTGGAVLMWVTRRRPGVSWAIGALLMWLASPVVALHTLALALVAIAPLAWPMATGPISERPRDDSVGSTTAIAGPDYRPG
jgi:alpha-1,2-mannosyltransferase